MASTELLLTAHDFESSLIAVDDQTLLLKNLRELNDDVLINMSDNTKKAYLKDFSDFVSFCKSQQLPIFTSDVEQSVQSVKAFFYHLADGQYTSHLKPAKNETPTVSGYKRSTIKRKLASVMFFIQSAGLPDPLKHSKNLRNLISNRLKKEDKKIPVKQPLALTLDILMTINRNMPIASLLDIRNRAIINTGLDTLFRASNLATIKFEHVDLEEQRVFIEYSKTDQDAEGHYAYISGETLNYIKAWIEASGIRDGFLFRRLAPKLKVQEKPLSTNSLYKIYRELSTYAGNNKAYSCHSTRIGAVVTLIEKGVDLSEIMLSGDWKSAAMPVHYGKQSKAKKIGMARIR
jgi:integrase